MDKNQPKTLTEAFKEWAVEAKVPDEAMKHAEVIFMTGADYAVMLMAERVNVLGSELTSLAGVEDAEN